MPESQVLIASKILDNTQFKALPTTAIQIVPAPGAGKIIRWLDAWLVLNNEAGVYVVNNAGSFLQLVYMSSPFAIEASGFVKIQAAAQVAGVHSSPIPPLASYDGAEGYLYWSPTDTGTATQNAGLGIADIYNGVPDYEDGNAANTLTVWVLYAVIES